MHPSAERLALVGRRLGPARPDDLSVNQFVHRFEELTGASGRERRVPLPMLRASLAAQQRALV